MCRPTLLCVCVCVDGGASCTVIWEKEKKKKYFRSGGKGRALHYTHTSVIYNQFPLFIYFFYFSVVWEKKDRSSCIWFSPATRWMYMYTERTARNCHSCFSGLSVSSDRTRHTNEPKSKYLKITHTQRCVCPAGMFSRAYSKSTCVIYVPVLLFISGCERERERSSSAHAKVSPKWFSYFRSRHL